MNLNDNRLIIKTLKSGDQKVFSLVYASYYKPLCLFCSSYVSLEEAEEIVQDLMMYVWEKRDAPECNPSVCKKERSGHEL